MHGDGKNCALAITIYISPPELLHYWPFLPLIAMRALGCLSCYFLHPCDFECFWMTAEA